MKRADDDTIEAHPRSVLVVALTGLHPNQEGYLISDDPDCTLTGHDQFVRYFREDQSSLQGFVPESWQSDCETLQRLLRARHDQFLADMEELQQVLDGNYPSTRDRLQKIRGIVERQRNTWAGRSEIFGKKSLDDGEGMI